MNHRIPWLGALIAVFSVLALPARAADSRERQPSPLDGVTALPDTEFERLAAEAKGRAQGSPPREEPGSTSAAAERARNARYEAALALQSPVARALALLLGRLSPQQWARLREPGWTLFS